MSAVFFSIDPENIEDLASLFRELSTRQSSQTGGPSESDAEDQHPLCCGCAMHLKLGTEAAATSSQGMPLETGKWAMEISYDGDQRKTLHNNCAYTNLRAARLKREGWPRNKKVIGDRTLGELARVGILDSYMRPFERASSVKVGGIIDNSFVNVHPTGASLTLDREWDPETLDRKLATFEVEARGLRNIWPEEQVDTYIRSIPLDLSPLDGPPSTAELDKFAGGFGSLRGKLHRNEL
ncbi:uncharacterized protein L203_101935 [Cryptococcus depauperatus CBS 7841]|uniref:Uncharacterized protein n=1 Tax=Cryptococcus depauperatus CBS 7841 TaxID=1295531 RepID=A0A1E3IHH0_9TREE|nr:hypothetical protein L203_03182 [Cryptococcus depauperatus CBS 7841]